jgi:hypothetical protein
VAIQDGELGMMRNRLVTVAGIDDTKVSYYRESPAFAKPNPETGKGVFWLQEMSLVSNETYRAMGGDQKYVAVRSVYEVDVCVPLGDGYNAQMALANAIVVAFQGAQLTLAGAIAAPMVLSAQKGGNRSENGWDKLPVLVTYEYQYIQ